MNNFRMWAYSMVAVGAINWDYQRHNPRVVAHSMLIIAPGLLLLAMTFVPVGALLLKKRSVQIAWLFIGTAALIYAFTNK